MEREGEGEGYIADRRRRGMNHVTPRARVSSSH